MAAKSCITEDLIPNILSKLPVKTLTRFKCLSRRLRSLIESPSFISTHLSHSLENRCLLVVSYGKAKRLIARPLLSNRGTTIYSRVPFIGDVGCYSGCDWRCCDLMVIGTFHGLVCYTFSYAVTNYEDFHYCSPKFVIWNPATRKLRFLPRSNPQWPVGLGFCSDPSTTAEEAFKVVKASFYGRHPQVSVRFDVIARSESRWRHISFDNTGYVHEKTYRPLFYDKGVAVAVQGALYWNVHDDILLSFSVLDESFQWIQFPPPLLKNSTMSLSLRGAFCGWKDLLAAVTYCTYFTPDCQFDMWVLMNGGGRGQDGFWSKFFSIKPLRFRIIDPLFIRGDRELVCGLSGTCYKDKLFVIDIFGEGAVTKFFDEGERIYHALNNYAESLVPV